MKIEYSILTPSKLLILFNDKQITLSGEATLTPAFYVNISSIKKWVPPFDNEEIRNEDKIELIQKITQLSQQEGRIRVFFK